jgi:hypothetical protein
MPTRRNELRMSLAFPDAKELTAVLRIDSTGIESFAENSHERLRPEFKDEIFPIRRDSQVGETDFGKISPGPSEHDPGTE